MRKRNYGYDMARETNRCTACRGKGEHETEDGYGATCGTCHGDGTVTRCACGAACPVMDDPECERCYRERREREEWADADRFAFEREHGWANSNAGLR